MGDGVLLGVDVDVVVSCTVHLGESDFLQCHRLFGFSSMVQLISASSVCALMLQRYGFFSKGYKYFGIFLAFGLRKIHFGFFLLLDEEMAGMLFLRCFLVSEYDKTKSLSAKFANRKSFVLCWFADVGECAYFCSHKMSDGIYP